MNVQKYNITLHDGTAGLSVDIIFFLRAWLACGPLFISILFLPSTGQGIPGSSIPPLILRRCYDCKPLKKSNHSTQETVAAKYNALLKKK
jgi:hypothetical protein